MRYIQGLSELPLPAQQGLPMVDGLYRSWRSRSIESIPVTDVRRDERLNALAVHLHPPARSVRYHVQNTNGSRNDWAPARRAPVVLHQRPAPSLKVLPSETMDCRLYSRLKQSHDMTC